MTEKIITVKQGQLPTAHEADEIRKNLVKGDFTVTAPLVQVVNEGGLHLQWDAPQAIWAKVTGSGSPYSFSEGRRREDDTWVDCCTKGTTNAHEVNHVGGLDGTYQLLYPSGPNEWRFMAIRSGVRINDFHIFATSCCLELTQPIHNDDCFARISPPTADGTGKADGNGRSYIKSVTVTNADNPDGLLLYQAKDNGNLDQSWSNRWDTDDPPLGKYTVVVSAYSLLFTYDDLHGNSVTEPVCTYGPDVTSEFVVGGDGYVPSYIDPSGGRVCDVWWLPGPHVTSSLRTVGAYRDANIYFGRLVGVSVSSNSLKIGTLLDGTYDPFATFQSTSDVIRVPDPADTKIKGTLVYGYGYFVGPPGNGDFHVKYCPVDYYASMCGIYDAAGKLLPGNVVPYDKTTCSDNPYSTPPPTPTPVQARMPSTKLDPDTLASLNPAFAAELVDAEPGLKILRAAQSCPHRTEPPCRCPQMPGRCALKKGNNGAVTLADCVSCIRSDGVTIEAHLNGYTGYAQHSIAIAKELEKLGHPVAFEPIERDDAGFIPLEEFAKKRIKL